MCTPWSLIQTGESGSPKGSEEGFDLTVFPKHLAFLKLWKSYDVTNIEVFYGVFLSQIFKRLPLSRWRWWPLVQGIPFSTRTCRSRRFGQGPGHSNKTQRTSRYAKYPSIVKVTLCSGHVFTSFHLFSRMHGHKNIVVIFLQLIFPL